LPDQGTSGEQSRSSGDKGGKITEWLVPTATNGFPNVLALEVAKARPSGGIEYPAQFNPRDGSQD
jgi:hypothetical protein